MHVADDKHNLETGRAQDRQPIINVIKRQVAMSELRFNKECSVSIVKLNLSQAQSFVLMMFTSRHNRQTRQCTDGFQQQRHPHHWPVTAEGVLLPELCLVVSNNRCPDLECEHYAKRLFVM